MNKTLKDKLESELCYYFNVLEKVVPELIKEWMQMYRDEVDPNYGYVVCIKKWVDSLYDENYNEDVDSTLACILFREDRETIKNFFIEEFGTTDIKLIVEW